MKNTAVYLISSVLLGIAGAVYEHFSFGVYSNYMIYAFAFPLIMGALPSCLIAVGRRDGSYGLRAARIYRVISAAAYKAAIITLTTGSVLKGILDIYGTTNRLLWVYPIAAAVLTAYAVIRAFLPEREAVDRNEAVKALPENTEYHRRGDPYDDACGNAAE